MREAAAKALGGLLCVGRGSRVLVVTDAARQSIGLAFHEAATGLGADSTLYMLDESGRPLASIPESLEDLLGPMEAAVNAFSGRPEETPFRIALIKKIMEAATRLGHAPGITEEMMTEGPMNVDFEALARSATRLMEALSGAVTAHVTAPGGTDLILRIEGRGFETDTVIRPGRWGNLPPGEIWCGPHEDAADGVLVCDGSIGDFGRVPSPVRIDIRSGRIASLACRDEEYASRLVKALSVDAESDVVGELGIGLNPGARVTGNLLEDEKAFRTVHVAFGNNEDMPGGRNGSRTHRDFLVRDPTMVVTFADGSERTLIEQGRIVVL
jgi:leucyl aminopeptidase (aminopeptidase T)